MKTNYSIRNLKKASIVGALLLSALFVSAADTLVETTVFADDFSSEESLSGGTPATTYSIFKQVLTGDTPDDPSYSASSLRIPAKTASTGRLGVMGTLSTYASPFASNLSEMNADSIVWTFNMRANVGTTAGFNDGDFAIATILLASSNDHTAANGYAVVSSNVNPPSSTRSFRLVKFTGGLDANSKISSIINLLPGNANTYPSLRITFVKSTNTWIFYGRLDGSSFADPAQGAFTHVASVVDNTYTSTAMSHFGFLMNYKSYSGGVNMFAFDYKVRTYHMDVDTRIAQNDVSKMFQTSLIPEGIQIEAVSAKATLYAVTGAIQNMVRISGKGTMHVNKKGLYLLKVEFPDGSSAVEKVLIQ